MATNMDKWIAQLSSSTTFQLSLGSKELFHSNFLYWLSIKDWSIFIKVMHELAKVDSFWWETGYKVEVRRESRNFDLSIYVQISKDQQDDSYRERWVPVLVLENKMKSLPYHEQLQRYFNKAFSEWPFKDLQAVCVSNPQPITFILLSLYTENKTTNFLECEYTRKCYKKDVQFKYEWISKNYLDLHDSLKSNNSHTSFTQLDCLVLEDYRNFIEALHYIAQDDWKVNAGDDFVGKIYPWANKGYQGDKQHELRIDDIRQKVHYSQLQRMLEEALKNAGIEAYHVSVGKPDVIRYGTSFAHNIGILEIAVKYPANLDDSYIFLQLQGDSYCHALCKYKGKVVDVLQNKKSELAFWLGNDRTQIEYPSKFKNYQILPFGENTRARDPRFKKFNYYGDGFIYQKVEIQTGVTVNDVISSMIEDIKKIISKLPITP